MPVTMKDIAKKAGVSTMSVSEALSGKGRISDKLRKKVLRVAEELQYKPNAQAQALRSGKTGNIGLVYSSENMSVFFPLEMMQGIEVGVEEHGFQVMLGHVPTADLGKGTALPALLKKWSVDGILIGNYLNVPPEILDHLAQISMPAVLLNHRGEQSCIYCDDEGAGMALTQRLLELGHTRIAYADFCHDPRDLNSGFHHSVVDRASGYELAMQKAQLEPRYIISPRTLSLNERSDFAYESLLDTADRPTAVVAYGNEAISVLTAALRLGIRVPEELSVATFAGRKLSFDRHMIGFMEQPYRQMGLEAVHMLREGIQGKDYKKSKALAYTFCPQDTIAQFCQ